MKKTFTLVGIPILVVVVFFIVYFPTVTRYRELKIQEAEMEKKIQELDQKISDLIEEQRLLQTNSQYLEKVIRDELGLVRPGETVVKIVEELPVLHDQYPSN